MFRKITQWIASKTFTWAGFILPQKGLLILLAVVLSLSGGLAYLWAKSNGYRVQVHVLADRLNRASEDIEVLRSMVRIAEQEATHAAQREAEMQYTVKKAQREVLRSASGGGTAAERLRSTREAAIDAIEAVEGGDAADAAAENPLSVPRTR